MVLSAHGAHFASPVHPCRTAPLQLALRSPPQCHFTAEVSGWLRSEGFRCRRCSLHVSSDQVRPFLLVRGASSPSPLLLHLLPTPRSAEAVLPAATTAALADAFAERRRPTLVHLWEDQWEEHARIVRSRLLAKLGRYQRVGASRTVARRIDSATADPFLLQNHLWATTKARYRYGLYRKRAPCELVAVATFSARWKKTQADGSKRSSHELIRYCSVEGVAVVGGISKLIAAFRRETLADECVTVIDRDWGAGGGWASLGFRSLRKLPPTTFYVGPDGRRCEAGAGPNPHRRRLPEELASAVAAMQAEGSTAAEADSYLAGHGYFAVHDAGAERHLLVFDDDTSPAAAIS